MQMSSSNIMNQREDSTHNFNNENGDPHTGSTLNTQDAAIKKIYSQKEFSSNQNSARSQHKENLNQGIISSSGNFKTNNLNQN